MGGGTGGVLPPPPGYARALRKVCDDHGVLMIADEIFCGIGRAGTWRALAADDVFPDLMTIAKGMSGGYMPLSGCVLSRKVRSTIDDRHGNVEMARTYSGHTAACAAGLAVLTVIERDDLVGKVARDGVYLKERLDAAQGGGVVDGTKGDYVLVSPPYIATRAELDEIVDKVALSIRQAVDAARAAA